jgi:hypothetical protein
MKKTPATAFKIAGINLAVPVPAKPNRTGPRRDLPCHTLPRCEKNYWNDFRAPAANLALPSHALPSRAEPCPAVPCQSKPSQTMKNEI